MIMTQIEIFFVFFIPPPPPSTVDVAFPTQPLAAGI